MTTQALLDDLTDARDAFHAAIAAIAPASMTTPGLVDEMSARDLIAHVGYWAGHAVEVIHAVEEGRADQVGADEVPVDEVNETVARVARQTDIAAVRKREAASFEALVERLRQMDAGLLSVSLPDGASLAEGIDEDGAAHYREHTEQLHRALREAPRG
ncbi:hypothetical protein BH23CHL9_BH23CHL9_06810 [soil metagenome]